jgi:hypothetical protein
MIGYATKEVCLKTACLLSLVVMLKDEDVCMDSLRDYEYYNLKNYI